MTPVLEENQLIPQERNRNVLWCRVILEELRAGGMTHVVLCPGGRASAFAMALALQPGITTLVHTDERSAAFIALGLSKALNRPVGICTTSGSAVANLIPGVLEAYHANLPVLILSCDRPTALRNSGAPQTADHAGMCRTSVQLSLDLPDPDATDTGLEELRRQFDTVRTHLALGPVHLNVPLRGFFTSMDREPQWQREPLSEAAYFGGDKRVPPTRERLQVSDSLPAGLELRPGMRGLIVAGSDGVLSAEQAGRLADATGFPLLADAPSGFRRPACSANLITAADLLTNSPAFVTEPVELIIRMGLAPVSNGLHRFLGLQSCPTLKIQARGEATDFISRTAHTLINPTDAALHELGRRLHSGDAGWLRFWQETAGNFNRKLEAHLSTASWGECQAAQMICNAPGFDFLHLANSMSVRHGNMFCKSAAHPQPIFANRGVNGIDGTLGTFFGELAGLQKRGLLLIGDLAFMHDLPALEAAKHAGLHGTICLVNNGGGAIFDLLGCEEIPDYNRFMRNPQGANFQRIAEGFGIPVQSCANKAELAAALEHSAQSAGIDLILLQFPANSLKGEVTEIFRACFSPATTRQSV